MPRKVDQGNLLATKRRKRRKSSEDQKPFRVFSCLFAAKFSGDCLTDGHKEAQKTQVGFDGHKRAQMTQKGTDRIFSCLFAAKSPDQIDGHKKAQESQKDRDSNNEWPQKSAKVAKFKWTKHLFVSFRASSRPNLLTRLMATKRLKGRKKSEDLKPFRVFSRLFAA